VASEPPRTTTATGTSTRGVRPPPAPLPPLALARPHPRVPALSPPRAGPGQDQPASCPAAGRPGCLATRRAGTSFHTSRVQQAARSSPGGSKLEAEAGVIPLPCCPALPAREGARPVLEQQQPTATHNGR
jgi:hypothetical protein